MIIVLFWVVVVLLALKLIGNLLLPYKVIQTNENEGISLSFGLLGDWFLFFCIVGLAWHISNPGFFYIVKNSVLVAGGSILTTYLHYFVVLSLAGLWNNRSK